MLPFDSIEKNKMQSFSVINEERLNMECFLLRRAFESQTNFSIDSENSNKVVQRNIKEKNPERSHSPPVRDRPIRTVSEKSLKNILTELLDKMMNKIYILAQFIKSSDMIAKNAVKISAFKDIDISTKQKRLDNYITRLQIKLFGLFQQIENVELFPENSSNFVIIIRGTVRLLEELNGALTNNYIGGPFDKRIEKIVVLCKKIVNVAATMPFLEYDDSSDVKILNFLEDTLKFFETKFSENKKISKVNIPRKIAQNLVKKINVFKPKQIPLSSIKNDKSTKDASIMTHSDENLENKKIIPTPQPNVNLIRSFSSPKNTILEALNRIEVNSKIINQRWNLIKNPQQKNEEIIEPKKKIMIKGSKVVMANTATINMFNNYKNNFESYLTEINYSTFDREISPWSFAARICEKIWDEFVKSVVYEISDVLDDALISEFFSELGCSVDQLLEPAEIDNNFVDGDFVGIPGFFMNLKD